MNTRAIGLGGILSAIIIGGAMGRSASAAPPPPAAEATSPCVNREKTEWRQVRDAAIEGDALRYCTGDDCWSMKLAGKDVVPIAKLPVSKRRLAQSGTFVDAKGAVLATATATHVEFCPSGPSSCKKFEFKFANPPTNGVFPVMNEEGTLGGVMYRGESEASQPSFVLVYDLAHGKLLKQLKANDLEVVRHGFLIDDVLYTAALKKLGKLAVPDHGWSRVGTTDLLALHDKKQGAIVFQDTATGKVKARVPLELQDHATWFTLVIAPDAARVYAIGSGLNEGEVVVIDVASGKLALRTTPTVCAAGTRRVN